MSPPSKAAKESANSTPSSPDRMKRERDDSANTLQDMMKLMMNITNTEPKIEEPNVLLNTEEVNLKVFFTETDAYTKAGGKRSLLEFINKSLLSNLRELELGDSKANEIDVLTYLKSQYQPSGWEAVHNVMTNDVVMDLSMTTPLTRLQSLFYSLTVAMERLGLQESKPASSCGTNFYPFNRQRKLLLSKLPNDFKAQFNAWQEYNNEAENRKELWDQLVTVSNGYKGEWGAPTNTKNSPSSRYAQDLDKYAKEHRENCAARKTRSMGDTA